MENNYKIYCLKEPDTDLVRYIGLTKNKLNARLSQHVCDRFRTVTHKSYWIQTLVKNAKRPTIELLEENLTLEQALEKEVFYIKFYKSAGVNLTNSTEGGDHYIEMTKEVKSKMNLAYRNSLRKGLKNNRSKPVLQIDRATGKILSAFESVRIATQTTNMSQSIIYDYIQGRHMYGGGYDWKIISIKDYESYKQYHNISSHKRILKEAVRVTV